MKKYLLSLITLTFFLCEASFIGGTAFAANKVGDSFTINYQDDNKVTIFSITYTITKTYTSSTNYGEVKATLSTPLSSSNYIVIPQTPSFNFSGTKYYNVTAIEANGFKNCTYLTSLTIPSTVTSIGSSAFEGCTSLTKITFNGTGVTSWPASMCKGCTSLTRIGGTSGRITVPTEVTSIGTSAFEGCTSLTSVYFDGTGVTSLPQDIFSGCTKLKTIGATSNVVTIPSNITSVGVDAFENCSTIVAVVIPTSVTSFGNYAFYNCSKVTSVTYAGDAARWGNISFGNAFSNPCYYAKGIKFSSSASVSTSITAGSSTYKTIKAYAFYNDTCLTSVTISSSATTINANAFNGCKNISSISIPASITSIADNTVFSGCSKLKTVTWNPTSYADCTSTTSTQPFYNVRSQITSFTFSTSSSFTKIQDYLCNGMTNLKSITIPQYVRTIGTNAFNGSGVESIIWNVDTIAPSTYTSSSQPFMNIKSQIKSFSFGSNVKNIPNYLCYQMTGLTAVTIPNNITTIGQYIFQGCSNLENITWNATNVKSCQSSWCSGVRGNIKSFTIGSSVTKVPAYMCYYMSGLDQLVSYTTTAPSTIGTSAFYSVTKCLTILPGATGYTSSPWTSFSPGICDNDVVSGVCGAQGDNLTWSLNLTTGLLTISGEGEMTNYSNSSPNYSPWYDVRSYIKSVEISEGATSIGDCAFYNCSNIEGILLLPNSLTYLGQRAFQNCSKITSVTIPENITIAGDYGFSGCTLLKNITWNARDCRQYKEGYPFSSSCGPFYQLTTQIESFSFGDAVEYIPAYLCYNKSNITSITIPENVTSIAADAFASCSSISSIIWKAKNCEDFTSSAQPFSSINTNIQSVTFGTAVEHIPAYLCNGMNNASFTSVTIPNGVTSIGTLAFNGCSRITSINWNAENCAGFSNYTSSPFYNIRANITSVTFGDEVRHIPASLCYYFNNNDFNSIEIPASVDSVGQYAFYSCSKLNSVNYLGDVNGWASIGFYGDNSNPVYYAKGLNIGGTPLTSYTISVPVKKYTFYNDTLLNSLTLADGCTSVGDKAFYGCSKLQSVSMSSDVLRFNTYAFYNCTSLAKESGGNVNYIGSANQWASINFYDYQANPAYYAQSLKLNNITLENCTLSVSVNPYVFYNNKSLSSLVLNGSCTSLGQNAFRDCTNLKSIDMTQADNLEAINNFAFWNCIGVAGELFIPASVITVGNGVFNGMSQITAIYAMPTAVPTGANQYTFGGFDTSIPFYVTSSAAASSYADAAYWQDFTNIHYSGYCGAAEGGLNLTWTFASTTGTLTISGTGAMADYANSTAMPWNSFKTSITSLTIEDGVTTIGTRAFYGCSSLASIIFPETFSSIGNYAFYNNTALTSVALPEGITDVGNSLFYGCTHLASVTLPSTLLSIGSSAFHSNAFTSISIPSSVSTISSYAFKNCTNLESIVVPNITILNEETFSGCSKLESITLPNTLTSIKKNAFINCSKLASITIPEYVTEIVCVQGSGSATCPFSGCTSLTSVVWNARACGGFSRVGQYQEYAMPFESIKTNIESFTFGTNVTSIPTYVCHGMTGLTDITIPASVTTIGANAFDGCTSLETVTSNATSVPSIASSTFPTAVEDAATLYVPATVAVRTAYSNDTYWSEFDHMLPYILSFNMNGHGDAIDPICVNSGRVDEAQKPADPADADYHSFGGWYQEAGCSTPFTFGEFGTVVNADKTIYAKWTIYNYQVTFDMQGHGSSIAAQTIDHNGLVSEPSAPSETGYTFGGWFKEAGCSNAWDFSNDHITAATTLYAKWTINSYDVTFDLQGHGDAIDAQSINYNGLVSEPSDPSAAGYTFGGWFKEAGCSNAWNFSNDHITAATILYAKWTINSYDVTFDLQGHGDPIASQSIDYNGLVSKPSDPEADNYTFGGWYKEAGCSNAWNFSEDHVTADKTLYAKWTLNGLALDENANNSSAISTYDGQTTNVTMTRSLTKAQYNTFCLPFDLSASQMATAFGAGYDLEELTDATYDDGTITLTFTQRTALEAGKPYLLQPANNVSNPSFSNVTISNATPNDGLDNTFIEFHGVYSPTLLASSENLLFLGAGNELFWPEAAGNIKGFRAYFEVKGPALSAVRARLIVGKGETQSIKEVNLQSSATNSKYIKDGMLFIERDGKTYNAQGILVE